jgi:hypothetical protein
LFLWLLLQLLLLLLLLLVSCPTYLALLANTAKLFAAVALTRAQMKL